MKISIIYNSHTGTTKGFADAMGRYLNEKGAETMVGSIDSYDKEFMESADLVLLGSWTSGLFFFAQHPDRPWHYFAERMPAITEKKVALFTTYKLATGSMFRKMEKKLRGKINAPEAILKSKSRMLTAEHKSILDGLTS
ncbi:MAG: flavodoxin family protein [Bacteroidota bacterium]